MPWSWDGRNGFSMFAEEQEACDDVARILSSHGHPFPGLRVVEVGCGRGACLHYAQSVLGASSVFGLDPSAGAVDATLRTIGEAGGKARRLGDEGAVEEAVAFGADLAWSHGVVEHLDGDDAIRAHVALLAKLSRKWVAISAPNPNSAIYATWRRRLLDQERWQWGFEEPLESYAPAAIAAGLIIVTDTTTARSRRAAAPFVRDRDGWTQEYRDEAPGFYTLLIARVTPVTLDAGVADAGAA